MSKYQTEFHQKVKISLKVKIFIRSICVLLDLLLFDPGDAKEQKNKHIR